MFLNKLRVSVQMRYLHAPYNDFMLLIKVKVNFTSEQATKAHRGSRSKAQSFLNLGAKLGGGGKAHAPAALPPGKTRYPLYRRLGGAQGRSVRMRKFRLHRDKKARPPASS